MTKKTFCSLAFMLSIVVNTFAVESENDDLRYELVSNIKEARVYEATYNWEKIKENVEMEAPERQESTYYKFSLSEPTIIDQTNIPGEGYWPDGKFCFLPKIDGGGWTCYWGEGDSYRTEAATTKLEDHIANNNWRKIMGKSVNKIEGFNDGGSWLIGAHRLESGKLVGFFHAESHWDDSGVAYKSIGVTYSDDDGLTWKQGQRIIATEDPKPETPTWSGLGDACVVWNESRQQYICYYQGWWLCMAASSDPNGAPGTWKIWDGNDFTIDACNQESQTASDHGKPINGLISHAGCNPSVMYNEYLHRWLMVYSGWNDYKIYMSFSENGIEWETPIVLLEEQGEGHRYPNLVSDEGGDLKGGKKMRLYYATNWREWGHRDIGCRTLVFEKEKIIFADANVKTLCVANWDINGDGELSDTEAASVTDLGEVFKGNTTITSFDELRYFTGLTGITNNAFQGCRNLTSISFPDNVETIGESAFEGSGLTSITIPDNITTIGKWAFQGCENIVTITLPESVKYIGGAAFAYSPKLHSINLPSQLKEISDWLFTNCFALKSIDIPENVITIKNNSFYGSGLTCITIPNSVTSIGENAFGNCSSLTSVTVMVSEPLPIIEPTFSHRAIATLYVPNGSKAAYEAADYWKEFKEIIEFNYVNVDEISIAAGESKSFEIGLTNEDTNLVGFQMDLTLPQGVGIDKTGCKLSSRISDKEQELTIGKLESGAYRITSTSLSLTPISGNEGTLLTLKLKAEEGCVGGKATISNIIFSSSESGKIIMSDESFDISVLYKVIYKVDGEVYKTDQFAYNTATTLINDEPKKEGYTFGGWSELPETMPAHDVEITGRFYLLGDVNTDEDVDVVDVVDIARFVVAKPSVKFREKLADLNKDNTVNIADAVTLVNHIAGDQNFAKAMAPSGLSYNYDQCQLQLLSAGQNAISLHLDGEADFTAFQFDVDVPEGTDISAIRINGMREDGHQLLYNKVENNRYRVTALSLSNAVFKGNMGKLLQFSSNGQITEDICVHDIHFVTKNGTGVAFDALYVSGNETRVANVNANENNDVIFDVQGRKLSKVQHGVNIINGKKVVNK